MAEPRRPAQERSRLRYERLVDAAEGLLATREMVEIGLYDIAAAAGLKPTSAYHLFPTKEAAFVAVAERYISALNHCIIAPIERGRLRRWQDFITIEMHRAIAFYNSHEVMLKLFFGATVIQEVRLLDVRNVETASATNYERMNQLFDMPYIDDADIKFAALIGIYDGLWMTSYARHGLITPAFARETELAAVAYCETFLPAVIPLRSPAPLSS